MYQGYSADSEAGVFMESSIQFRHGQRRCFIIAVALAAAAFVACSSSAAQTTTPAARAAVAVSTGADFPLTVTDSSNTQVVFYQAPKRIISYSPAATEVLFAVGAGSQVVAVDKFSNYPKDTDALPKVEYSKPAPEPAVALNPDLVIMATRQEGQVPQFRALGLTVLLLKEPANLAGVLDQIRLVGQVTGHAAEGEKLASGMQKRIDAVAAKVAALPAGPSPKVFYELTADGFTVGPNSFIGSLLQTAKLTNVADKTTGDFPQVSSEVVIAANPDIILLADGNADTGGTESPATVKARPGWGNLAAVKSGHVFLIDADIFSRPGPRVVDALEQIVKLCYPGLQ
jgi:iron complex transport system substrate-binding protein